MLLGRFFLSVFVVCGASAFAAARSGKTIGEAQSALAGLPLRFEANRGQWNPEVRYAARSGRGALFLTERGPVVANGAHQVRISLVHRNIQARLEPLERLPGRTDYFVGNREQWHAGVANFARIAHRSVYPGIDVIYYGNCDQLEYDFVLQPHADPRLIRLQFRGADRVSLTREGDLAVESAGARFVQKRPVIYQQSPGAAPHRLVEGRYELLTGGVVGVRLGSYDRSQALVVDPVVSFAEFVGGSSTDVINAVATDAAGFLYVAGYTQSPDLTPVGNFVQPGYSAGLDAFVAVLDPNFTGAASLVYLTYLGGARDDSATAIAVDSLGTIYVTGTTTSSDFPQSGASVQTALALSTSGSSVFPKDAFVTIIGRSDGLEYSTYYGGTANETPNAIAVDTRGLMYILGTTESSDLPVTSNNYQAGLWGPSDLFLAQIDRNSQALVYASYLGGESYDDGRGLAVDSNGLVYFAATTTSQLFPMSGASYRGTLTGFENIVVGVLDLTQPGLNALIYATYFGGSIVDDVRKLSLDAKGRVLLAGWTLSSDFPVTPNALMATYGGLGNGFVARLNPFAQPGSFVEYATFVGGSGGDVAYDVTGDGSGVLYVTGYTLSPDFPVTPDAAQRHFGNGIEAFLVKINPGANGAAALQYGTYLGGVGVHVGKGVALGPGGSIYVGGYTTADFEVPALSNGYSFGSSDGFVAVLK